MPIIKGTTGSNSGGFLIDDILHPRGVYPYVDADDNFYFKFKNGNIYLKQGKLEDWTLANRDGGSEPITYTYTLIDGITLLTDQTRKRSYTEPGLNNRWSFADNAKFLESDFIPIGSRMAVGDNPNSFGRTPVTWTFVTTTRTPRKEGNVWIVDVDRAISEPEFTRLSADNKLRLWTNKDKTENLGEHLNDIARLTYSA